MNADEALLWAVVGIIAAQRAVELVVSRGNERALAARGGVRASGDGFGLFVAVHAGLLVLVPAEFFTTTWAGTGIHTWPLLAVAVAADAVRYWAAASLGDRYTVRVIRVPREALTSRGPYRWVRHPIYLAALVVVAAVPAAFGCWATAAYLTLLNAVAVVRRVRVEERHLARASPS